MGQELFSCGTTQIDTVCIHFPTHVLMRPWLITGQAPVDAYLGLLPFRSPSEVHSIPV